MKKEIWKPVVGYEGLYEVSNWGRVKSIKFGKEIILKQSKNKKTGRLHVVLCKNGILKTYSVHRLVAEAFIDNPNNYKEVNHKDENPQNNVVSNLEWCDAKYNCNYGTRNKRISEKMTNGKLSKSVLQYDLEGNFIKEWKSTAECGRNGFCNHHVAACCRGERKTHKGFIWRYEKDQDV